MLPEKTLNWGLKRSCIRELMEYGAKRSEEIGRENVYDYSVGNPSVPSPDIINKSIIDIINDPVLSKEIHKYTTAAGLMSLRKAIADDLNKRFNLNIDPGLMYVTCGAAAALTISLRATVNPGEEVIALAPFFPEYRVFTEGAGGKLVVVPAANDFHINLDALEKAINPRTRAIIINTPNNPAGTVYRDDEMIKMAKILHDAEAKYSESIFLITDEPYREIVFDGRVNPNVFDYYDNAIMCYSFSKSLSVPGERIGYIALNPKMPDINNVYAGIMGAGRALGYVNPPSLFQKVIERSIGNYSDLSEYDANRKLLCEGLKKIGYEYVEPEGAFYLFVKSLEPDAEHFSDRAKAHDLLFPASNDFGCEGYVRISYCVPKSQIEKSMQAFKDLYDEYRK